MWRMLPPIFGRRKKRRILSCLLLSCFFCFFFRSRFSGTSQKLAKFAGNALGVTLHHWTVWTLRKSGGLQQLLPHRSNNCTFAYFSGGKKPNKHKQLRGIVPEMGGGQTVYVFPFLLGRKGKHINKFPGNLRKRPGQSRDNPGTIP